MKKLMAVSSALALVLASGGLFAVDIPVGDGGGKFTLDMQAEYEFDVITDTSKEHDNDKNWIEELDADKQGKLSIGAAYDGDNYAFGVGGGFRQNRASTDDNKGWYLDDAWGKYYFLDKQLWLRGGSMDGLWRIDTDPLNKNYGGDNGPGLQINFAPSALTGFNVGVALPVPAPGSRGTADDGTAPSFKDQNDPTKFDPFNPTYEAASFKKYGNWGPAYPVMNMAFGLRLNQTIPNLDFGAELDLKGLESTNWKPGADEKEGDFIGMNFHFTAVYTFAPVTVKAAMLVENIADGRDYGDISTPDPLVSAGIRVVFDIPNGEGSALDLGDPWVQFQILPGRFGKSRVDDSVTVYFKDKKFEEILLMGEQESFKDMFIDFEWEPSYSIVPDQIKALFLIGFGYAIWADAPDKSAEKDYPLFFGVRPGIEFKFAPNATLKIQDKISFVQKEKKGIKNEFGFRFAWGF